MRNLVTIIYEAARLKTAERLSNLTMSSVENERVKKLLKYLKVVDIFAKIFRIHCRHCGHICPVMLRVDFWPTHLPNGLCFAIVFFFIFNGLTPLRTN